MGRGVSRKGVPKPGLGTRDGTEFGTRKREVWDRGTGTKFGKPERPSMVIIRWATSLTTPSFFEPSESFRRSLLWKNQEFHPVQKDKDLICKELLVLRCRRAGRAL